MGTSNDIIPATTNTKPLDLYGNHLAETEIRDSKKRFPPSKLVLTCHSKTLLMKIADRSMANIIYSSEQGPPCHLGMVSHVNLTVQAVTFPLDIDMQNIYRHQGLQNNLKRFLELDSIDVWCMELLYLANFLITPLLHSCETSTCFENANQTNLVLATYYLDPSAWLDPVGETGSSPLSTPQTILCYYLLGRCWLHHRDSAL